MKFKTALIKAVKGIWNAVPMIIGIVLLIGLVNTLLPQEIYSKIFTNTPFDLVIASSIGSILAGNPITSYIIGNELLTQGVNIIAVTAFIVAWVTVGLVTLPAEMTLLGKKFAITRNAVSFIFSIIVAIITYGVLSIL